VHKRCGQTGPSSARIGRSPFISSQLAGIWLIASVARPHAQAPRLSANLRRKSAALCTIDMPRIVLTRYLTFYPAPQKTLKEPGSALRFYFEPLPLSASSRCPRHALTRSGSSKPHLDRVQPSRSTAQAVRLRPKSGETGPCTGCRRPLLHLYAGSP